MSRPLKIVLCDLVHNWVGAGTYMFPLNVGYLAAYVQQRFPDVQFEIFKFPNEFLEYIEINKADIIGFSNYIWNANLNLEMAKYAKGNNPNSLVVFGGPEFQYDETGTRDFFLKNLYCDYYVPFQGEKPFLNIVENYLSNQNEKKVPGAIYYDRDKDEIIRGEKLDRIPEPNEINSPYLTGLLDKFFETNLIPIIETNRGCPYQCTFCAQGLVSYNSVNYFSMERVKGELDYVASKVKNTPLLHFADANFGIVNRDIEIAEYCKELRESKGYPAKVSSNMAKNRPPAKMIEIAKLFGDTAMVISLQSLDTLVLSNVKRSNIKIAKFEEIIDSVNADNGISGTEIILGLPGETYESHMLTLRKLFDRRVSYIIAYNALILKGTELDDDRRSGKFKFKTKYRLIDSSFGEYDFPIKDSHNVTGLYKDKVILEYEEGIRETETLTEEEILSFRPIHWLIQFMWNYRFYYDFLRGLQEVGINPLDFIIKVNENALKDIFSPVFRLFDDFKKESISEWFDTPSDLIKHYSDKDNLEGLRNGSFGKMNGKYIFIALTEFKTVFEGHIKSTLDKFNINNQEKTRLIQVLMFNSVSIIDINLLLKDQSSFSKKCSIDYDVMRWRNEGYTKPLESYNLKIDYVFDMDEEDKILLNRLIKQYWHKNFNVTLRKMSEYMPLKKLFLTEKTGMGVINSSDLISIQLDRAGVGQ
jgi:radical SAM superfamily enzyme YgiQ (UPF0313 family)